MFNPRPSVTQVPLGQGRVCVVLDDALLSPERLPAFADAYREDFHPASPDVFPGLRLRMPDDFTGLLHDVLRDHARHTLGVRRILRSTSRLSLLSLAGDALPPSHWLPRRERWPEPDQRLVAAELFLFRDATLGGTHFFLPIVSPQQVAEIEHDADALSPDAFSRRHGVAAGYPHASTIACFAHAVTVPARWNRLVMHDADVFRAPAVPHGVRLDTAPRRGRLTLQAALVCSRNRVAW